MSSGKSTSSPESAEPGTDFPPRRRLLALAAALSVFIPALSYAVFADAPLIPLLAAFPLLLSVAIPHGVPVTSRSSVYTLVVAAIITVILQQVYKVSPDRFYMPLAPAELLVPFFLAIAVGLCFMVQSSQTLSLIAVFTVMVLLLQGTSINDPVNNVRLPVKGTLLDDRFTTFTITITLYLLTILPVLHAAQPRRLAALMRTDRHRRARRVWWGASLSAVVVFSVIMGLFLPKALSNLELLSAPWVSEYFQRMSTPRIFGDTVNLNETVGLQDKIHATKIIFRVNSKIPPGYLRGRVYSFYEAGHWKGIPLGGSLPTLPVDPDLAIHRFVVDPAYDTSSPLPTETVEIFPSDRYQTNVLFLPGSTKVVDTIASHLVYDPNGTVGPSEWDSQGGYTAYVGGLSQMDAWQHPKPADAPDDTLLEVPDAVRPTMEQFATTILGTDPVPPATAMRRVAFWLQNNYDYKLGVNIPDKMDPAVAFLTTLKQGHCELYATAAALILRSRGIPARYVTGFVCMERHPIEDFWIARYGDAHAWVEAYDAEHGEWVLVEATPASAVPAGLDRSTWLDKLHETLRARWEPVFVLIKRGYFADAVMGVFRGLWGSILWFLRDGPWYLGWPILIGCLYSLGRYLFRHRPRARRRGPKPPPELTLLLARIDLLLRRYHIHRQPSSSIRDLRRLATAPDSGAPPGLDALLHDYEMLRYNPEPPRESVVKDLATRADLLLKAPPPPPTTSGATS